MSFFNYLKFTSFILFFSMFFFLISLKLENQIAIFFKCCLLGLTHLLKLVVFWLHPLDRLNITFILTYEVADLSIESLFLLLHFLYFVQIGFTLVPLAIVCSKVLFTDFNCLIQLIDLTLVLLQFLRLLQHIPLRRFECLF